MDFVDSYFNYVSYEVIPTFSLSLCLKIVQNFGFFRQSVMFITVITLIILFSIFLSIQLFLNNKEYFLISLSSKKARVNLVNYLDKYTLFSSKFLNYIDWRECHYLINNNEHLTEKGQNIALLLKSKMNTKRTYYN